MNTRKQAGPLSKGECSLEVLFDKKNNKITFVFKIKKFYSAQAENHAHIKSETQTPPTIVTQLKVKDRFK